MQTSLFSGRDLAHVLPDTVEGIVHKVDNKDKAEAFKPHIDVTKKVTRYFPGKAPKWVPEEDEEVLADFRRQRQESVAVPSKPKKDSRLERLSRRVEEATVISGEDNSRARARARARARSLREEEDSATPAERGFAVDDKDPVEEQRVPVPEEDEEEDEALEDRRARIRAAALKRREEEVPVLDDEGEEEDDSDESSSEYETDSEDEGWTGRRHAMMKPVFVPKGTRKSIQEAEAAAKAEEERERKRLAAKEERKRASRSLVAATVAQELAAEAAEEEVAGVGSDADMPDDEYVALVSSLAPIPPPAPAMVCVCVCAHPSGLFCSSQPPPQVRG